MRQLDPDTINPPAPRRRFPRRTLLLALVALGFFVRFMLQRMEHHAVKSEPPASQSPGMQVDVAPTTPAVPKRNP